MRVRGLVAAMLLMVLGAASTAAQEQSVQDWIGHDPFQPQDGRNLFEIPMLVQHLKRLPWQPPRPEFLRSPYDVQQVGQLLVAYVCERRNCGQRNWALLYDLETGEVGLCDYQAQISSSAMSYTLGLSRSYLSARLELRGTLSQTMPNGCLDPEGAGLVQLWAVGRLLN